MYMSPTNSYQEALSDLISAISLHPSLFSAHLLTGLLHHSFLNSSSRAVRCLSSALRVDPTSTTALLARAQALHSQGKVRASLSFFPLSISPPLPPAEGSRERLQSTDTHVPSHHDCIHPQRKPLQTTQQHHQSQGTCLVCPPMM